MSPLLTAAHSIEAADDPADLASVPRLRHLDRSAIIEGVRRSVPFDFITVSGLDIDGYRYGSFASVDSDTPPAFLEAYGAEKLYKTDPFVLGADGTQNLLVEEDVYSRFAPPQRLLYLTRSFGIGKRTVIVLRRNTVVYGAVCFMRQETFSREELDYLEMVAKPLHNRITAPLMERFAMASTRLSQGELICIDKASWGLTSDEIAERTGYQKDTVDSYLKAAIRKLGVSNRVQAVSEALRRQLIH